MSIIGKLSFNGVVEIQEIDSNMFSIEGNEQQHLNQAEIAQLAEELLQMAGLGWQPIETAPDDTELLLFCPDSGYEIGSGDGDLWWTSDINRRIEPTHWRPLPPKP